MKVVRILAGVVAVLLVILGGAVAVLLGPDDTWGAEPGPLPADVPVVVTAPGLLNVAGVDLVVRARAGEGEVFVGAGHPVHVQDYVREVRRIEVTGLSADGVDTTQTLEGERAHPAVPPADLGVWDEQASGRDVRLSVPLTEEAPVQIAVLPAEAKGEAPQLGIGYAVPGAFVAAVVAVAVGLLVLAGLVVRRRRARRAGLDAADEERAVDGDPVGSSGSLGHTATRVVLAGALAVAVTGCSIPTRVDHGDDVGVVPLEEDDAQAALDDYDRRNNAAIEKSHTGDGRLWSRADAGPLLAEDVVSAKINAVDEPTGEPGTFTHTLDAVFETRQAGYPLWTVVAVRGSTQEASDGSALRVMTKDRAAQPWRAYASVWVDDGAPTPLPAQEATAGPEDLVRAEEVDTLLQTWVEKGKVSGLEVPLVLEEFRSGIREGSGTGIDRFEDRADSWGGIDERTAPGGSVQALRVEEGLLVLTSQEWENRAHLKPDYVWKPTTKETKVYGQHDESTVKERHYALSAAILVPDTGEARVIGSSVHRIIDFPR